jgi:hypothetical protein
MAHPFLGMFSKENTFRLAQMYWRMEREDPDAHRLLTLVADALPAEARATGPPRAIAMALFVSNRQQFNETVCYLGGELVRLLLRTFPAEDRSRIQAARGCPLDEDKPPLDEAVCCFVLAPARFAELEQQVLAWKKLFLFYQAATQSCKALWRLRESPWWDNASLWMVVLANK